MPPEAAPSAPEISNGVAAAAPDTGTGAVGSLPNALLLQAAKTRRRRNVVEAGKGVFLGNSPAEGRRVVARIVRMKKLRKQPILHADRVRGGGGGGKGVFLGNSRREMAERVRRILDERDHKQS